MDLPTVASGSSSCCKAYAFRRHVLCLHEHQPFRELMVAIRRLEVFAAVIVNSQSSYVYSFVFRWLHHHYPYFLRTVTDRSPGFQVYKWRLILVQPCIKRLLNHYCRSPYNGESNGKDNCNMKWKIGEHWYLRNLI